MVSLERRQLIAWQLQVWQGDRLEAVRTCAVTAPEDRERVAKRLREVYPGADIRERELWL